MSGLTSYTQKRQNKPLIIKKSHKIYNPQHNKIEVKSSMELYILKLSWVLALFSNSVRTKMPLISSCLSCCLQSKVDFAHLIYALIIAVCSLSNCVVCFTFCFHFSASQTLSQISHSVALDLALPRSPTLNSFSHNIPTKETLVSVVLGILLGASIWADPWKPKFLNVLSKPSNLVSTVLSRSHNRRRKTFRFPLSHTSAFIVFCPEHSSRKPLCCVRMSNQVTLTHACVHSVKGFLNLLSGLKKRRMGFSKISYPRKDKGIDFV